jgi:hypothetical protein
MATATMWVMLLLYYPPSGEFRVGFKTGFETSQACLEASREAIARGKAQMLHIQSGCIEVPLLNKKTS